MSTFAVTHSATGTVTEPAPPDTPCECCTEGRATRSVTSEGGVVKEYPIHTCERCFNEVEADKRRRGRHAEHV